MPIRVQDELPAVNFLRSENVFVMTTTRATTQEIRPLKVLILNLMPKKIETENQFLRLLSNSPLQLDIQLQRRVGKQSQKLILSLNFLRHQIKDEHLQRADFLSRRASCRHHKDVFITQEIDGR